ncbi:helicase C-terminal domain-containing protein [Paenibacillus mesotrionivorans]|uniref:Helicase C-terminal domain-containing protein n=1 Tax=Paenibacillus mesotrionivorans TaxID=3160968 RepID=A0ACC7P399_9BACL
MRIPVSVRGLAEYAFRAGSIDGSFRTSTPLAEGTRIHKAVQAEYGSADRTEVFLSGEFPYEELQFVLEGRCDGLRQDEEGAFIEEIKSTASTLENPAIQAGLPVHWAQACCYACLFTRQEGLDGIRVRLLYVHTGSDQRHAITRQFSSGELEEAVAAMLAVYAPFARMSAAHIALRGPSIKSLPFPYEGYRPGQRKLAGAVYQAITEGRKLFVRAPTGTGKTMSTLFPAVKAVGEGLAERVMYVTARTTGRAAAEEAFSLMDKQGLIFRRVTLTAKEKICFQEEVRCTPEACPYADGHYDRVNGAMLDLLGHETAITRQVVEQYARKHRVCPFEFSLDAAYESDAMIGDYNYVFDPVVALKRVGDADRKKTVVLADEAHNLPDRAREMYSAALDKSAFLQLSRSFKSAAGLYRSSRGINAWFIAMRKQLQNGDSPRLAAPPEELGPLLEEFRQEAEAMLASGAQSGGPGDSLLADTYYAVLGYLRVAEGFGEEYAVFVEEERQELHLRLYCLNPSRLLEQAGKSYRSHVFFSATLAPIRFYQELLGGSEEDYGLAVPSPFQREQLRVLHAPVSIRYRDREQNIGPVAGLIDVLLREQSGNAIVFFSSYDYMRKVHARYMEEHPSPSHLILLQEAGMGEEEREAFLACFRADAETPVLAFAVLGGIFAEGVDLPGDRLKAVAVIGTGLPQVGLTRNMIREYYDRSGRDGFQYAYVYPGMGKVLQAGGRLIRSEADTGTLLLVDDRYRMPPYWDLLPEEWKPPEPLKLPSFWGNQEG